MNMQVLDARREVSGGYKVDVTRGERIGRVSSEWFSRPDDERFLSLSDLAHAVRDRAEHSRTRIVETNLIHVEANRADGERLLLFLPGAKAPVAPTHWSFGQLASQIGAPAAYLRQLPAALAGINLQYGLTSHRAEQIKTLETEGDRCDPLHEIEDAGGRMALLGQYRVDDLCGLGLREASPPQEVAAGLVVLRHDPLARRLDAVDERHRRGVSEVEQCWCGLVGEAGRSVFRVADGDLLEILDAPQVGRFD